MRDVIEELIEARLDQLHVPVKSLSPGQLEAQYGRSSRVSDGYHYVVPLAGCDCVFSTWVLGIAGAADTDRIEALNEELAEMQAGGAVVGRHLIAIDIKRLPYQLYGALLSPPRFETSPATLESTFQPFFRTFWTGREMSRLAR